MPTSVALGPHFETFVKEQLGGGRYNNASEVLRAGLRLLEDQQKLDAIKLADLRKAIRDGLTSGPARPAQAVFERLESKYRSARRR